MNFKNSFNGSNGVPVKNRSLIKKRAAPNISDKRLTKPCVNEPLPEVKKNENPNKVQSSLLDPVSSNVDAPLDHRVSNELKNDEVSSHLAVVSTQKNENVEKTVPKCDIVSKETPIISIDVSPKNTETVEQLENIMSGSSDNPHSFDLLSVPSDVHNESDSIHKTALEVQNSNKFIRRRAAPSVRCNKPKVQNVCPSKSLSVHSDDLNKNLCVGIKEGKLEDSSGDNEKLFQSENPCLPLTEPDNAAKQPKNEIQPINSKCLRKRAAPSLPSKSIPNKKSKEVNVNTVQIQKRTSPKINMSDLTSNNSNTEVKDTTPKLSTVTKGGDLNEDALTKMTVEKNEFCVSPEMSASTEKNLEPAPPLACKSFPNKKLKEVNVNTNFKKRALPKISQSLPKKTNSKERGVLSIEEKFENSNEDTLNKMESNEGLCASLEDKIINEPKTGMLYKEKDLNDINLQVPTHSQSENTKKEQEKNVERVIRVYLNSWPKYPRSDPFSDEPDHDLRTIKECGSISIWKQNKFHIAICDLMEPIDLGKTPKNWAYVHLNKLIKEEIIDPDYETENYEQINNQTYDIESNVQPTEIEDNEPNLHIIKNNDQNKNLTQCLDIKESETNNLIPTLSHTSNITPSSDLSKPTEKIDADIEEKKKAKPIKKRRCTPRNLVDKERITVGEKVSQEKSKGSVELKKNTRRSSRKRDKENISSSSSENVKKSPQEVKKSRKLKPKEKLPEVKGNNNNTALSFGKMSSMIKSKWKNNSTPPDQNKLSLKDFIIYVPPSEPMKEESNKNEDQEETETEDCEIISEQSDVPKLIIRDGEIVVDPSSTMIKRTPLPIKNDNVERYRKNNDTRDLWDLSDTIKFYRTLWKYGIDFSMITSTFLDKSRISIKRKYKYEQKHHSSLVDYVLSGRNVDFKSVMRQLIIISGNEAIRKKKLLKKESTKSVTTPHFLGPTKKKSKRGRKPKNQADPKENSKKQAVLKKLFENDPSVINDTALGEIIIAEDVNSIDLNDIITFSTNLVYEDMNIVESVSFNPTNVVQPVDFNVTISHDPGPMKESDQKKEEISSTSVIKL